MTLILHTYTDLRLDDQKETRVQIGFIGDYYGTKVISEKMIAPDDYWSFLLRHWGKEDIIIIEQDVVPSVGKIARIRDCHYKVCTYPHILAAGQWSVFDIEPQTGRFDTFNLAYFWTMYPRFADGSSLGFIKISLDTQKRIPLWEYPVAKYEWWYLDSFISWHLKRLHQRVHVHASEVKHNRTVEVTFQLGDETIVVSNKD